MNKEKIFSIFHSLSFSSPLILSLTQQMMGNTKDTQKKREHTKNLNACPMNTALVLLVLAFQMMGYLYFSYSSCFATTTTGGGGDGMMIVIAVCMALSVELCYTYSFTTFSPVFQKHPIHIFTFTLAYYFHNM